MVEAKPAESRNELVVSIVFRLLLNCRWIIFTPTTEVPFVRRKAYRKSINILFLPHFFEETSAINGRSGDYYQVDYVEHMFIDQDECVLDQNTHNMVKYIIMVYPKDQVKK